MLFFMGDGVVGVCVGYLSAIGSEWTLLKSYCPSLREHSSGCIRCYCACGAERRGESAQAEGGNGGLLFSLPFDASDAHIATGAK